MSAMMTGHTAKKCSPPRQVIWWFVMLVSVMTSCSPAIRVAPPAQLQAWVVYFDADRGLAEVSEHGALFDRISLFAYELSPDGTPQPAPRVSDMIPRFMEAAEDLDFMPWVTVVNDVRFSSDSAILKDSSLVHDLVTDETRRHEHARALAAIALGGGFAGVHLDYEQVSDSDSSAFRLFVGTLDSALAANGLGLEVLIEPSRGPLPMPSTTNVSVMGYDLHGAHSGPGPRATPEFVKSLLPRAQGDVDSKAGLAIAVGGFAWRPDGAVVVVDWDSAADISADLRIRRSRPDGVPSVRLEDGTVVWFEDRESLVNKWDAAWRSGFRRLLVWRLGGNDEQLFALLRELMQGEARL